MCSLISTRHRCEKQFSLLNHRQNCRFCGAAVCNNCSLRTHLNANSKNPKRICDGCWETQVNNSGTIAILSKPTEVPVASAMETLGAELQMALLTSPRALLTSPRPVSTVIAPDWTRPIRAESMSIEDVRLQLTARNLDSTGTDSELIERLQAVLDTEQSKVTAAKRKLAGTNANRVICR